MLTLTRHHPDSDDWPAFVDESRARLGGADNPALMPAHYLQVVLPKIGGCAFSVHRQGQLAGYAYTFPRGLDGETRLYTLRFHSLPPAPVADGAAITRRAEELLPPGSRAIFYDSATPKSYQPDHRMFDGLDVGRPDAAEAQDARTIQQVVWNNPPEVLYPADIYSAEFALPTALVARADGRTAGFLFGLTKFDGAALPSVWQERLRHRLRLESQTMGVLPDFRGRHIAYLLKKVQAEQAQAQKIDIISWTADPLQFPNAALNFTRLGAVAYEAQPALYAFHNELNQAPASRFSLTWLVGTERVQAILAGRQPTAVVDLAGQPAVARVNDGPVSPRYDADAPAIAFEIPADWTALQRADLAEARRWRETTDRLFLHYLGKEPDRYIVTDAAVDGPRRYLLARRVDEALLARLM